MKLPKTISFENPKSPMAEAFRSLRTNIRFYSIEKKLQTIVVTSPEPGDGKSTTALNLSLLLAMGGHRTLLLDCDLRNPSVHLVFHLPNEDGLSSLLAGDTTLSAAACSTSVNRLYVLPSGEKPPNPSELLGSSVMKLLIDSLRMQYEYIIIDSPPVLMMTDAQILSQYADGCLLVISSGKSRKEIVANAIEQMRKVNANIIGVVLNKVSKTNSCFYSSDYEHYCSRWNQNKMRQHKIKRKAGEKPGFMT